MLYKKEISSFKKPKGRAYDLDVSKKKHFILLLRGFFWKNDDIGHFLKILKR